ncbi:tetraacyldisaccharide 4'-kinase, partial [Pseudomonas syringae group genomosp. 7]|uniref:tetraacyldisaccharide 4'-kinase n=1 Tax=Pseudomonas syringae group genomosp. 7 TaxID=251699 RepID=UPI0037700320
VESKRARFLAGDGRIYRAPVPVIVVGNYTDPGTRKTTLILCKIEHCRTPSLRDAVVRRVYGAKPPRLPCRVRAAQRAGK